MPAPAHVVHGERAWYRDSAAPLVRLRGTLEPRVAAVGPGDRGGLDYLLRTADRSWPVYATGATGVLGRFVGHRVEVEARVVDPDGSGTEELWVGRLTDLDGDG